MRHNHVSKHARRNMYLLAASGLMLAGAGTASAETAGQWYSWDGSAGNNLFNDPANWTNVTDVAQAGGVIDATDVRSGNDFAVLWNAPADAAQTIIVDSTSEVMRLFMRATGNRSYTINPLDGSSKLVFNDRRITYGRQDTPFQILPGDPPVSVPVAGLTVNANIETKDANGYQIQRLDLGAPTLQMNGSITGHASLGLGGKFGILALGNTTTDDTSQVGAHAVLLAQATQTRD